MRASAQTASLTPLPSARRGLTIPRLADLGVGRISGGSALADAASFAALNAVLARR